jgi:SAM-dependent methyltransferase
MSIVCVVALAGDYDAFYATDGEPVRFVDLATRKHPGRRDEAILSVPGTGAALLDIGCGDGFLLFCHRHRFEKLIGLEYSPVRATQAKANLVGLDVDVHVGTAEGMTEIESGSIDRVVTSDVIEHVSDVYRAIDEVFRILRPGGTLVVNTPNVAYVKRRVQLLAGRFPSTSQPNEGLGSDLLFDGGHLHYFTFRSLTLLLERARFNVVARSGYGRFGWPHSIYPPLTSVGVQIVASKPEQVNQ